MLCPAIEESFEIGHNHRDIRCLGAIVSCSLHKVVTSINAQNLSQ